MQLFRRPRAAVTTGILAGLVGIACDATGAGPDTPGAPGPTGPRGARGPDGAPGAPGPAGRPGPAGVDGRPGAPGVNGAAGAIGPAGPDGTPGPAGPEGVAGQTGPAGRTGADGAPGAAGPRGPQGPQGFTGPSGVTGPKGATGPAGAFGPIGASVVGPQGPQGPVGPQGDIGLAGPQGLPGPSGPSGDPGVLGAQGPVGPMGDVGVAGLPGQPGAPCWDGDTTDDNVTDVVDCRGVTDAPICPPGEELLWPGLFFESWRCVPRPITPATGRRAIFEDFDSGLPGTWRLSAAIMGGSDSRWFIQVTADPATILFPFPAQDVLAGSAATRFQIRTEGRAGDTAFGLYSGTNVSAPGEPLIGFFANGDEWFTICPGAGLQSFGTFEGNHFAITVDPASGQVIFEHIDGEFDDVRVVRMDCTGPGTVRSIALTSTNQILIDYVGLEVNR